MPRAKTPPTRPRVVAIANNKGGVGKTTTAINLAGALVLREKKVLVLDLDPQKNASVALDVVIDADSLGTKLLLQDDQFSVQDCAYDKGDYLDIIPAHRTLADIQYPLLMNPAGRLRLREKLKSGGKPYDFVFLDCSPDLGSLTQSALIAASDVIVPIDVGYFSVDGLQDMLDLLDQVREAYNPTLNLLGILVTRYDARTTLSLNTVNSIRMVDLPLLEPPIRVCVEIIRAQMERMPVSLAAPSSTGAADYEALANALLNPPAPAKRSKKVVPIRRNRA